MAAAATRSKAAAGPAETHGATAEGNPSAGNLQRGLYNIALKSLGAAMKRHPDVRLERVVEYGEPLLFDRHVTGPIFAICRDPVFAICHKLILFLS